jgi:hypothetical protein
VSELAEARQRFLSRVVDHALEDGWRTADDFLRHFPPSAIVASLAGVDELRVALLVATTGTHERIALKKSVASAAEDLELALAERAASPATLLSLYPPDDRVRYLDAKKLWQFVVEDEFFRVSASDETRHGRASSRLLFIVECALSEGLITLKDVADGVGFEDIAAALPVKDLREVVKHALTIARAGAPLTEERFLAIVPLASLIDHLKLEHVWQRVVVDRVAVPAGFVEPPAPAAPAAEPVPDIPAPVAAPPIAATPASVPPPPLPPAAAATAAAPAEPSRPDDDEVRRRVIERLRVIDRLPPGHDDLSTPVLLSVESMYADLWAVNDDDEREACIRESFPNESLLRTAMLALIELLDPSVDTHDPIIREADVSGLIKIVLFEERRRRDAGASSRRTPPSTGTKGSRRSIPPPLPRSSTPPPLPPTESTRSSPPPLPADAAKRDR